MSDCAAPPDLAAALESVRRRIGEACRRVHRAPASVALVAVSKSVPASRVRELLACGQALFGENRIQEAMEKVPLVGTGARWHLVGHLQRNKAKHAVGAFELIHSVDGTELARELERRAAARGVVQPVLVEVNVAGEASKQGTDEASLPAVLDTISGLVHLELQGLMCVPPPAESPEQARRWFARLRELRDAARSRMGRELPELSMGMSEDFEVAVEEGATLVRVGRALFGPRIEA